MEDQQKRRRSARLQQKYGSQPYDSSRYRLDSSELSEHSGKRTPKISRETKSNRNLIRRNEKKKSLFPTACLLTAVFATIGAAGGKMGFSPAPNVIAQISPYLGYLFRCMMLAVLLGANGISFKYYVRALCDFSAFAATVMIFALNFICSGFAGYLLFGESLVLKWYIGSSLMLGGVAIIMNESKKHSGTKSKHLENRFVD